MEFPWVLRRFNEVHERGPMDLSGILVALVGVSGLASEPAHSRPTPHDYLTSSKGLASAILRNASNRSA
jgi:hypothetical protein